MSEAIHLFLPTFRVDEVLAEIRETLESGWTGAGAKTVQIERAWRQHTGLPYAHFVNSATSGLHLAIRLLKETYDWKDGDEIITTPLTFVATNHVILYERLTPRFADVDGYLCLDPDSVRERITPRTRAVCFVGLGGNPARYAEVRELCYEKDLRLILDAAHMTGTWVDSRHAGWDADVSVFSFHAVKNLPTADAGMVCFARADLDDQARQWSWMGINRDTYSRTVGGGRYKWQYDVDRLGFKYHGNSVMAAMGLVGLRYLEQDNAYRRQLAAWYDEELSPCPGVRTVPMLEGCLPSRHLYQILVERRDDVMIGLNQNKIYPGVHYHDNTLYRMYAYADGTCPRARHASQRLISLPLHLRLGQEDIRRVTETLKKILERLPPA